MKIIKKSTQVKPKVSIILLDWSVRESFHFLHYIKDQTISRNDFEVIIIEYYSTLSKEIKKFAGQVDTWILLERPEDCYYHKHLMYNVGLAYANGEIIIICDSDAMVKPTFLESVISTFANNDNIFLHLDQYRNNRRDLYPFCYPTFEEVEGYGCDNAYYGKTKGLHISNDVLHNRNYGACFCAKREDLINIGGSDEHVDYVGHVCGPYDLSFRLINAGKKEMWHQYEFLYHTWHPGQSGNNNYNGPHDGREMSSTALTTLFSGQIYPHVANPYITKLALKQDDLMEPTEDELILPQHKNLSIKFLTSSKFTSLAESQYKIIPYQGYYIFCKPDGFYAVLYKDAVKASKLPFNTKIPKHLWQYSSKELFEIKKSINKKQGGFYKISSKFLNVINQFQLFYKVLIWLTKYSLKYFIRILKKIKRILRSIASKIKRLILNLYSRAKNKLANKLSSIEGGIKLGSPSLDVLMSNLIKTPNNMRICILTTDKTNYYSIKFLTKIFLFHNIKVNLIKESYSEVSEALNQFNKHKTPGTLYISKDFYLMYLYLFTKEEFEDKLCIL